MNSLRALNGSSLVMLLTLSGYASAQATPDNCHALVEVRNDLWLMKLDNSNPTQLTHDGIPKFTIGGVSPSGKIIAYLDEASDDIILMDVTGKFLSRINVNAEGGVNGLRWVNSSILEVAEHVSPRASIFHFVDIPRDGLHPVLLTQVSAVEGVACTPSPSYRDLACISSVSRDGIALNGSDQDMYSVTDSFVSATELQTLDVAVGSSVTTTTSPPFRVQVTEIVDGQVGLKVTTPEEAALGQPAQTVFVTNDYTMPVAVGGDINDNVPPTVYGFTASVRHASQAPAKRDEGSSQQHAAKAAVVTVHVVKSVTGYYEIEGDLAWSPDGRRIAAVEKNGLGQRWLILLNGRATQGKGESRNLRDEDHGNIEGREVLPIDGPISRIDFTSDTHVRVEGATQTFEQNIPVYGKLPDGAKYNLTPALPKQFSTADGNIFIPIYGWVCQ